MRVVIDTNVIVSGLLNPFGAPAEILRLVITGGITPVYDSRIISEYTEVLKRPKFKSNQENVALFIKEIELSGLSVFPLPVKITLPDTDDLIFLEAALAGNANGIITGNKNHFPQELCAGIPVFSPAEFILYYKENILNEN